MTPPTRQLEPGQLAPDGLAHRLAGHYSTRATDVLARLYWTGGVLPGSAGACRRIAADPPDLDAHGNRDPQAIQAELRALEHYCRVHEGRAFVPAWHARAAGQAAAAQLRVPWAWRPPEDLEAQVRGRYRQDADAVAEG